MLRFLNFSIKCLYVLLQQYDHQSAISTHLNYVILVRTLKTISLLLSLLE